jgi:hypothetical protein
MCAGNSVNQHYRQKLDPSLNNGPYSQEEDEIILKHVQEHLSWAWATGRGLTTVPWVKCAERLKRSGETLPSEWRMYFVGAVSSAFVVVPYAHFMSVLHHSLYSFSYPLVCSTHAYALFFPQPFALLILCIFNTHARTHAQF